MDSPPCAVAMRVLDVDAPRASDSDFHIALDGHFLGTATKALTRAILPECRFVTGLGRSSASSTRRNQSGCNVHQLML